MRRYVLLVLVMTVVMGWAAVRGFAAAGAEVVDPLALATQITEELRSGRFEEVEARFAPELRSALPSGQLAAVWAALEAQSGTLETVGKPYLVGEEPAVQVRQPVTFGQQVLDLLYALDDQGRLTGLWVVPHLAAPESPETAEQLPSYVNPDGFTEVELTVGKPPYELPATLTLPKAQGPFPGVVLVHGSGPNDRDERIGPNRPFRDLAWGLASQGIAVLRYDKRTFVYASQLDPAEATLEAEVVEDALAAVEVLAARPEISQVYLLGHSLGGTLAPVIARQSSRIAGLVLLAAMARPISQVVPEQLQYLAEVDGTVTAEEQAQVEAFRSALAQAVSGGLEPSTLVLGAPAGYWQALDALDPVAVARELEQPILVLQGGRDYQVTEADFRCFQEGLAGRDQVEFHLFPELNHLFMAGQGPSHPGEYEQPGHVAPDVVETITRWVKADAGP